MKKVIVSLLTATVILSVTACGKTTSEFTELPEDEIVSEISVENVEVAPVDTQAQPEQAQITQVQQEESESREEPEVALTQEELSEIEEIIGTDEYGGFLMTEYDSAWDIDWSEVLYSGANIGSVGTASDEEVAAFEKKLGHELMGDVLSIKRTDIEAFVKKNTGHDYAEANKPFRGTYIEKYDTYYAQRSDACFPKFKVVSGTKKGDEYTVYTEDQDGYRGRRASYFTFKKNGPFLVVLSHKFA